MQGTEPRGLRYRLHDVAALRFDVVYVNVMWGRQVIEYWLGDCDHSR